MYYKVPVLLFLGKNEEKMFQKEKVPKLRQKIIEKLGEKAKKEIFMIFLFSGFFSPYIFSVLLKVLRQSKYSSFSSCLKNSLKKRDHFALSQQASLHLK